MFRIGVLFTVRNEVAKVMFFQVCVCPQGGVCPWGVPAPGGVPGPGGCLLLGGEGLVSQDALRQTPPGGTATAWYASYWNAFLFITKFLYGDLNLLRSIQA